MSVQIVHDQSDFGTFGILHFQQMPDLMSPVNLGSMLLWTRVTPTGQGFSKQEDTAGTIADILIILTLGPVTFHRNRLPCFAKQLIRLLIHADHRVFRVVWLLVQIQNILHASDKGGVLFGWDHPALVQMWLQFVFFRSRNTDSCEMLSMI